MKEIYVNIFVAHLFFHPLNFPNILEGIDLFKGLTLGEKEKRELEEIYYQARTKLETLLTEEDIQNFRRIMILTKSFRDAYHALSLSQAQKNQIRLLRKVTKKQVVHFMNTYPALRKIIAERIRNRIRAKRQIDEPQLANF